MEVAFMNLALAQRCEPDSNIDWNLGSTTSVDLMGAWSYSESSVLFGLSQQQLPGAIRLDY